MSYISTFQSELAQFFHKNFIQTLLLSPYFSVLAISVLPLVPFLFLERLFSHQIDLNNATMSKTMSFLLAFAAGALLSEAFEHFLPEAYYLSIKSNFFGSRNRHFQKLRNHKHESLYESISESPGMMLIASIFFLFIVEIALKILMKSSSVICDHCNQNTSSSNTKNSNSNNSGASLRKRFSTRSSENDSNSPPSSPTSKSKSNRNEDYTAHTQIGSMALVGLISDFLHNFTDGIAIALSYRIGKSVAISTTLSIMAHELPHEFSDLAILLQSRVSYRKAMLAQLLTASGGLLGCFLIRILGKLNDSLMALFFSITAGGFVYISLIGIMPQLRSNTRDMLGLARISVAFLAGTFLHLFLGNLH